jgi:hypothetical protein
MGGRRLLTATAALFGAITLALPAAAQFGGIFGGPPRPPAEVPQGGANDDDRYYSTRSNPSPWTRQPQVVSPPPQGYPQQGYPQQGYPPPPQGYPPQQGYPQQGYPQQANRPPAAPPGVQQQELPPPPGVAAVPPQRNTPPGTNPALPGQPPGQRQPTATPGDTPTTPAPPNDEVVIAPPAQKVPNAQAVFSGLDKITGRIISFDVAINETVQFGALQVTPRVCYTRPPTEAPNTDAFIEVDEITLQGEIRRLFTGWMYAASPGLHAIEHPIYDIWLSDCKGPQVPAVADAGEPPQQAQPPRGSAQPKQRQKQALPPPGTAAPQVVPPPQGARAQQQPKQQQQQQLPPPPRSFIQ